MKTNSKAYCWLMGSLCLWLLCAWVAQQPRPVKKAPSKPPIARSVTTHHLTGQAARAQPVPKKTVVSADLVSAGTVAVDPESGLALDKNLMLVKGQCTACHSSKLILQSHFDREKWIERIRWMQRTQKLWDLGESEPTVLAYLTKYYGPLAIPFDGRRLPLLMPVWYKP